MRSPGKQLKCRTRLRAACSAGFQTGCNVGLQTHVRIWMYILSMVPSFSASGSASLHGAAPPRFGGVHIRNRGRLPHWEQEAGLHFVISHLADSLPKDVLRKIAERHQILAEAKKTGARLLPGQKARLAEYSRARIEAYVDRGFGNPRYSRSGGRRYPVTISLKSAMVEKLRSTSSMRPRFAPRTSRRGRAP